MDKDAFTKQVIEVFKEFSEKVNFITGKFERDTEALSKKSEELKTQIEKLSQAENNHIRAELLLQDKIDENEKLSNDLKSEKVRLDKEDKRLIARKEELDTRLQYLNAEKEAIVASNIEIENKYKYLEIEERRLKLYEHKISLLMEDKEIAEKMKKIGDVKLINEVWK